MKKSILVLLSILFYFTSFCQPYKSSLKALNEYLKVFNPETYRDIEVKDSTVHFKFVYYTQVYETRIGIKELKQNTTVGKVNFFGTDEIKIICNNKSKCFYSNFSKENVDHFRFFSKTVNDLSKIEELVSKFIKSLK